MALFSLLEEVGRPPVSVETEAKVRLEETGTGYAITRIELATRGHVPGLDEAGFIRMAERAKETCRVSRALAGVEVVLDASLEGHQVVADIGFVTNMLDQ